MAYENPLHDDNRAAARFATHSRSVLVLFGITGRYLFATVSASDALVILTLQHSNFNRVRCRNLVLGFGQEQSYITQFGKNLELY